MSVYEDGNGVSDDLKNTSNELGSMAKDLYNTKNNLSDYYGHRKANQGNKGVNSNKDLNGSGLKAGKQAGKQAAKEAGKQVGKEAGKQAGKQAAKEAGKQAGKQAASAVTSAATATGTGAAVGTTAGPVGTVAGAVIGFVVSNLKTIGKVLITIFILLVIFVCLVVGTLPTLVLNGFQYVNTVEQQTEGSSGNSLVNLITTAISGITQSMYDAFFDEGDDTDTLTERKYLQMLVDTVDESVENANTNLSARIKEMCEENGYDYETTMNNITNTSADAFRGLDYATIISAYSCKYDNADESKITKKEFAKRLKEFDTDMLDIEITPKTSSIATPVEYFDYEPHTYYILKDGAYKAYTYYTLGKSHSSEKSVTIDSYSRITIESYRRTYNPSDGFLYYYDSTQTVYKPDGKKVTISPETKTVTYGTVNVTAITADDIYNIFDIDKTSPYYEDEPKGQTYEEVIIDKAEMLNYLLEDELGIEPGDYTYNNDDDFTYAEGDGIYNGTLKWPLDNPHITSHFGPRKSYQCKNGNYMSSYHKGIDLGCATGTKIYAAAGGEVVFTGYNDSRGKYVIVKHSPNLYTLYQHLSAFRVKKGQKVSQGQVIALSGESGNCTGPHLHFSVFTKYSGGYCSDYKNPEHYLP